MFLKRVIWLWAIQIGCLAFPTFQNSPAMVRRRGVEYLNVARSHTDISSEDGTLNWKDDGVVKNGLPRATHVGSMGVFELPTFPSWKLNTHIIERRQRTTSYASVNYHFSLISMHIYMPRDSN